MYQRNLCTYLQYFIGGVLKGLLLGAAIVALAGTMINGLVSFAANFGHLKDMTEFDAVGFLVDVIAITLGLIALFLHLKEIYGWEFGSNKVAYEPSFVGEAYRSWKDKTCVFLEFEDKE